MSMVTSPQIEACSPEHLPEQTARHNVTANHVAESRWSIYTFTGTRQHLAAFFADAYDMDDCEFAEFMS